MANEYIPFLSKIKEIVKHTETEYTFRMTYVGDVRPGQFFEVSVPKYGEAPISVSGIGEDYVDLTIRKVGKVTGEIFELNEGSSFFMRGPYGNGFEKENYQGKELIVVAGGTGVSPVRGVISYFGEHQNEVKKLHTILGFKSPSDILFREDLKNAYNDWIRTTDLVDGCIDFDLAIRDPQNPKAFAKGCDSGDHLHPSKEGYIRMAEAVPEGILTI